MVMRRTTLACAALTTAALAFPAGASAADAIYAATDDGRLLRFNSDSPGQIVTNEPFRGLAAGEQVVGIDVRPSDDQLFAVTSANRAVQVNPTTGAIRPAFGPFAPALSGSTFGVDFNPVANALRIVSDADQNLRVTDNNLTVPDGNLSYAPGDAGAGTNPVVTAAAYSNSVPGASSTTLYDLDTGRDVLVRQDPPNAGTLATVGALGANYDEQAAFDIAPGGTAYAALRPSGQQAFSLHRIDLSNGRATPSSSRAGIALPGGALRGIAVAGGVADDNTRPEMSVAFSSTILEQNTATLEPSVSCDETCTVTVEAEVQGRDAGEGTATIQGAGRETVRVRLNAAARARIARRGTELISLDIVGVDAAGNRTSQNNRVSRTQTLAVRRG
jgi:Domain of unknown function (DUF4394)